MLSEAANVPEAAPTDGQAFSVRNQQTIVVTAVVALVMALACALAAASGDLVGAIGTGVIFLITARGSWQAVRCKVMVTPDSIRVPGFLGTKTYRTCDIESAQSGFNGQGFPQAILTLRSGKHVRLQPTTGRRTAAGRARVEAVVADLNRTLH